MAVIESLQVLMHDLQLSMQDFKSLVPSSGVGLPPVPHQLELVLILHFVSLCAGFMDCL